MSSFLLSLNLRIPAVLRMKTRGRKIILTIYLYRYTANEHLRLRFSSQLSNTGINYYTRYTENSSFTWQMYKAKLNDFHQSAMVKICYHFVGARNAIYNCFEHLIRFIGWLHMVFTSI